MKHGFMKIQAVIIHTYITYRPSTDTTFFFNIIQIKQNMTHH